MTGFEPISAAIGGALIGLAATALMLFAGRIAGISGIFAGCLNSNTIDRGWRLAFIAGLVIAPLTARLFGAPPLTPQMPASWAIVVIAGLLVGVGTRLAGGCTSGHGVCGIARISPRSITATVVFMIMAVVVVAVMRHGLGG
jgi:uncharacterized protein